MDSESLMYQPTENEDYYKTLLGLCQSKDYLNYTEYSYKGWRICYHRSDTDWEGTGIHELCLDPSSIVLEAQNKEGFTAEYTITYIDEHSR